MFKISSLLKRHWPIVALVVTALALFVTNFVPGTYLLGWDNTVPELNLGLNFQRFLFGIWQEYRGLGTLDGMAHVANLAHWLYVAFLSLFLPQNAVRYAMLLIYHLVGGIGMFVLIKNDVLPTLLKISHHDSDDTSVEFKAKWIALITAWFYMLNLMTVQMFFPPLELFVVHFAILPWGFYTLRRYLRDPNIRNLGWVFVVNLLGTPQAHVPTVFIPYSVALGIMLLFSVRFSVKSWKVAIVAGFTLIAANAFWGIPYLYSALTKSSEIAAAKQNRLGTNDIFFLNNAYGNVWDVLKFGGFQLTYRDWSISDNTFIPTMMSWVALYRNPLYQGVAMTVSLLAWVGAVLIVVQALRRRNGQLLPFVFIAFFAILMLGSDVPILRNISNVLRDQIPFFFQIFRFTFTKFSLLYVSVLFVLLSVTLAQITVPRPKSARSLLLSRGLPVVAIFALAVMSYPAFMGQFFYPALKIKLPTEYSQLTDFFRDNSDISRYATFPIHTLWGWLDNSNQWGYRGSGFLWQVIEQPMVDRSFDGWSQTNETMYLQMSQSLYTQNQRAFTKTFEKYFTDTILLDRSIFQPGSYQQVLFYKVIDRFFSEIPEIVPLQQIGSLDIFSLRSITPGFELVAPRLVNILSDTYVSKYAVKDEAYDDYGPYVQLRNQGTIYPFSALQREDVTTGQLDKDGFVLHETIPAGYRLVWPSLAQSQAAVTGVVTGQLVSSRLNLDFKLQTPEVTVNNQVLKLPETIVNAVVDLPTVSNRYFLTLNDGVTPFASADLVGSPETLSRFIVKPTSDLMVRVFSATPQLVNESTQLTQTNSPCPADHTCRSFELPNVEGDVTSLGVVSLDFPPPKEGKDPLICIFAASAPETCLNQAALEQPALRSDLKSISSTAFLRPGVSYGLRVTDDLPFDALQFERLAIQYHSALLELPFPIKDSVANFDRAVASLPSETPATVDIRIPAGPDSSFVLTHDWTDSRTEKDTRNCRSELGSVAKQLFADHIEYRSTGGAIVCDTHFYPELSTQLEYLYHLRGQTKSGMGLKVFLVNPETKRFDINLVTGLTSFDLWSTLYPSQNVYEPTADAFQLTFNGQSYGREENIVDVYQSDFMPAPLSWITGIHALPTTPSQLTSDVSITGQSHPWIPVFMADVQVNSPTGLLVLPESFDQAWWLFGAGPRESVRHLVFNGWANAWQIPQGEYTVVLFYGPQLLIFGGLVITGLAGIWLSVAWWRYQKKHPSGDSTSPHRTTHLHKVRHSLKGLK